MGSMVKYSAVRNYKNTKNTNTVNITNSKEYYTERDKKCSLNKIRFNFRDLKFPYTQHTGDTFTIYYLYTDTV